ncbi:hypothetical protein GCM10009868_16890 [Terrabacter aerolatus]|uniref:DUF2029 domain-containing protein n=1 Tax=Terrabacter aerolatus TaxID=422442 RepID=A0A512D218_9MICO|nr:hypothetical protein [Terrabacter aerolatus]GEO30511.1 hypothetical protein TAE01_23210 [Terrabacter aerolatus]
MTVQRSEEDAAVWPLSRDWLRGTCRRELLPVWLVLGGWTVLWGAYAVQNLLMRSWGIFPMAARILLSGGPSGGLHLYSVRPDFQFGPVSVLVAAPLAHLSLHGSKWVAGVLMTVAGLWLVAVIAGSKARDVGIPARRPLLVGGLLVMPVWPLLSLTSGHLDDVLALGFGLFGILQVQRRNPVWAAALLALAVDSKPWALPFGVALLALPRTQWLKAAAVFGGLVAAAWLPFFIADPATIAAVKFQLHISYGSVLSIFHLSGPIPPWVRPAQLVVAVAIGMLAVRAGVLQAILLATVAGRILLDPAIASYYTAGAVMVAFFMDRTRSWRVPWFTVAVVVLLWAPQLVQLGNDWYVVTRWLRLLWGVGTLAALVVTLLRHGRPVAQEAGQTAA